MLQIKAFKQADERWGNIVIGRGTNPDGSKYDMTMAGFGCYDTCVASALWAFQIDTDPGRLANMLLAMKPKGFTDDGLVKNASITDLFPWVVYEGSVMTDLLKKGDGNKTMSSSLRQIERMLGIGFPVIVSVDAAINDGRKAATHFVLFADWNNGDPLFMDPITGKVDLLSKHYGKPQDAIFNFRVFVGPPTTPFMDLHEGVAAWKISQAKKELKSKNYSLSGQFLDEALVGFMQ
jgi:hypothetical protein